jgi:Lrp/AsnC family transcriptional regulator, leucine-responsive regulatory protein
MINDIDLQILNIIQQDARITNAEIARQVGLAPSAVLERLRKLEDRGIVRGYTADITPKEVGFGLTVFVSVRTSECGSDAGRAIAEIPEVLEVHDVAGEDCLLLKIRTRDTEELGKLLREKIKSVPTVLSTRTTVVLQTFKESNALPLDRMENAPRTPGRKRVEPRKLKVSEVRNEKK